MTEQISLFAPTDLWSNPGSSDRLEPLLMSREALITWKQQIARYQQQVRTSQPMHQATLFDLGSAADPTDPDRIDPFSLPQQNTEFWRWRAADQGVAALYFVIDYDLSLLLYVGETVKSNQRWKGEHDCKRYLLNYRQAHVQTGLSTTLGIAFWPQAPVQTRPRQKLELALIHKWKAPFNKENWETWGTPFTGGK